MEKQTNGAERNDRKTFEGIVVSDRMDKTRVVTVGRQTRHAFYEKVIRKSSKFYVHDEANASHEGDLVEIASTRPLSRLKRWRLVRVVKAAPRVANDPLAKERKEKEPRPAAAAKGGAK